MKVLITGSRNFNDFFLMRQEILASGATVIVHGAARGADTIAEGIAKEQEIDYRGYPAKWKAHGRSAGPRRNAFMLAKEHRADEPVDLVLAFPLEDSIGTFDMIERAEKAGLKVKVCG